MKGMKKEMKKEKITGRRNGGYVDQISNAASFIELMTNRDSASWKAVYKELYMLLFNSSTVVGYYYFDKLHLQSE
ncbi:hypothetical protein VNO78_10697 [Psophocarpus tetragonolobus]|uniref:Uncharacterized protein n=1 Tax=Psophocarpus tetragonolobus TaxID=3891 RepID=A0AAN9SLQ9_PSOTE